MKFTTLRFSSLSAIILAACAVNANADIPTPVMTFSPPDSIVFVVKEIDATARVLDTSIRLADSTFLTTEYHLNKISNGFQVASRPKSASYSRNGVKVENEVSQIASGIPVTIQLDIRGTATSASGYELLMSRIDSLKDQKVAKQIREILNPQTMADKDVREWNSRVSPLLDKQVKLGVMQHDTSSLSLASGSMQHFYTATVLLDTARVEGVLRAHILTASDTDPANVAKALKLSTKEVAQLFDLGDSSFSNEPSDSWYRSTNDITVDTETLLFHSESLRREIQAPVTTKEGKTVNSRMIETIRRTYEYPKR